MDILRSVAELVLIEHFQHFREDLLSIAETDGEVCASAVRATGPDERVRSAGNEAGYGYA